MAKKRKVKRRKKTVGTKKRRVAAVPRAAGVGGMVRQLTAYRAALMAQQADLQTQIDQLGEALDALGAAPTAARGPGRKPRVKRAGKRGGARGRREGSLKTYILRVLSKGGEQKVKDIAAAVRRAGYKTGSANFGNQVSNALAQMEEVTKTGRGMYKC